MCALSRLSRRQFGLGLGAGLARAVLPRQVAGHAGHGWVEVRVSRFTFQPEHLDISVGGGVVWINEDLAPHTATARDGAWETGVLGTGSSARVIFDRAGHFDYFCAFHPHMTGSVSIRPDTGG
jgi:plastocyanin